MTKFPLDRLYEAAAEALAKRAIEEGITKFHEVSWEKLMRKMGQEEELRDPKDRLGFVRILSYNHKIIVRVLRSAGRMFDKMMFEKGEPALKSVIPEKPSVQLEKDPEKPVASEFSKPITEGPMESVLNLRLDRDCYPTSQIKLLLEKYVHDNIGSTVSVEFLKLHNHEDFWYDIHVAHTVPISVVVKVLSVVPWVLECRSKPPRFFGRKMVGVR